MGIIHAEDVQKDSVSESKAKARKARLREGRRKGRAEDADGTEAVPPEGSNLRHDWFAGSGRPA